MNRLFAKAGPVDEPRDAQGRWTGTGLHAEARNFFGRFGSSIKSGWAGLSDAEKAAAYVAIAGAAGFTITRGANRLPLTLHAHLADWMAAASKYFSTTAPIGHAATAAAATHVGAKLLEGGFPHAASRVHGLAMTLGAAAAAATHPKVRAFLSNAATKLGETAMTRMVGKSFSHAGGGTFRHLASSAPRMPSIGSVSGEPLLRQHDLSSARMRGMNLYDYRQQLKAEAHKASDAFHQKRGASRFADRAQGGDL